VCVCVCVCGFAGLANSSQILGTYTVSKKNVPPSICYNLDMHDPITIIFSRKVTEKVRNRMMLCFPTSPV